MEDTTHVPLLGAILCCTSIPPEQRSHLASAAEQMGAVHKYDLTSDVTHMIVGKTDTPKYKFVAKERPDIKCLLPSWIEAVRDSWMAGEETNVEELEQQHRAPAFYGLQICVTGFVDDRRKYLEEAIVQNGGEYKPNLSKDETHLIAREPTGAKYEFAGKWGIKIVSIEWLEQSLERGMILDETLYHPLVPVEKRGENAWIRRTTSASSLGKRTRGAEQGQDRSRKLRRTTSARLERQNTGVWGDIVQQPETKGENGTVEDTKAQHAHVNPKNSSHERPEIQRAASFKEPPTNLSRGEHIFRGKRFILHGFEDKKTTILTRHLVTRGGVVADRSDDEPVDEMLDFPNTFLIIPHTQRSTSLPPSLASFPHRRLATENWVERCAYTKSYKDPSRHVMNQPFKTFPLAGFKALKLSTTGFQGIDKVHVGKAVKLIGASYEETFDRTISVLICGSLDNSKEKLLHARYWGVPAVRADWLWESISGERLLPFDASYLVQAWSKPPADRATPAQDSVSKQQQQQQHLPLREITPNSSPGKDASNNTTDQNSKPPPPPPAAQPEPLGETISSLLAAHQHQRTSSPNKPSANDNSSSSFSRQGRRRQLLGRASSNSSLHRDQNQSRTFSRASSVDTLNTDGLGTPVDTSAGVGTLGESTSGKRASGVVYDAAVLDQEVEHEHAEQEAMQSTQLGWRPDGANDGAKGGASGRGSRDETGRSTRRRTRQSGGLP